MTKKPLTFDQATRICADYQYLAGRKFSNGHIIATVSCVVVVPYDDINKYIFLLEYRNCEDAVKALEIYKNDVFDVVLLGKIEAERTHYVCKELDNYLLENGIPYDVTSYAA